MHLKLESLDAIKYAAEMDRVDLDLLTRLRLKQQKASRLANTMPYAFPNTRQ